MTKITSDVKVKNVFLIAKKSKARVQNDFAPKRLLPPIPNMSNQVPWWLSAIFIAHNYPARSIVIPNSFFYPGFPGWHTEERIRFWAWPWCIWTDVVAKGRHTKGFVPADAKPKHKQSVSSQGCFTPITV
ncbi:MAG: hypothetical protein QM642_07795 [Edaphocola sp.]